MAWIYSSWQTATSVSAITAVNVSAGTFTVSFDQRDLVKAGDRLNVSSGANIGKYTVTAISYTPDSTVVSVTPAPSSAVVAGNLVFGPTNSTQMDNLRKHHAEVSAAIAASVGSNGTSIDTGTLLDYLKNFVNPELIKLQRAIGGMFMAGQLKRLM